MTFKHSPCHFVKHVASLAHGNVTVSKIAMMTYDLRHIHWYVSVNIALTFGHCMHSNITNLDMVQL